MSTVGWLALDETSTAELIETATACRFIDVG